MRSPVMDRARILRHLAEAEDHVAEGQTRLNRQREIVAELERDGHDSAMARELLRQFESVQAMHIAGLARVTRELAETPS